jgi:hypothetical protein
MKRKAQKNKINRRKMRKGKGREKRRGGSRAACVAADVGLSS